MTEWTVPYILLSVPRFVPISFTSLPLLHNYQFTIQPQQHVIRISEPFLLWHYDYACHNYYHFLVDALPVLIVGLRALNGSLPVVRVMANQLQVGARHAGQGDELTGEVSVPNATLPHDKWLHDRPEKGRMGFVASAYYELGRI